MINIFRKHPKEKLPYLERVDSFEKLDIVRLKGRLDHDMIPIVESRIKTNRAAGSIIDRNVVLDFAMVDHVDSALIATHVIHLKEYQEKGFTIAFLNVTEEWRALVDIFKENEEFKVYATEDQAIQDLNK